jgi:hypothetical protein
MAEPAHDETQDDDKIKRTDNSLRPEDKKLEQPPQDPDHIPDSVVAPDGKPA